MRGVDAPPRPCATSACWIARWSGSRNFQAAKSRGSAWPALWRGARDLLLGDEPFASLDLPLARRLAEDLRRLATRDGVTVVLALHQIALARALADRIIGVNDGRVLFDGPACAFDPDCRSAGFRLSRRRGAKPDSDRERMLK